MHNIIILIIRYTDTEELDSDYNSLGKRRTPITLQSRQKGGGKVGSKECCF